LSSPAITTTWSPFLMLYLGLNLLLTLFVFYAYCLLAKFPTPQSLLFILNAVC
jgi:hypothetical protein